jgi:hypothetical protein
MLLQQMLCCMLHALLQLYAATCYCNRCSAACCMICCSSRMQHALLQLLQFHAACNCNRASVAVACVSSCCYMCVRLLLQQSMLNCNSCNRGMLQHATASEHAACNWASVAVACWACNHATATSLCCSSRRTHVQHVATSCNMLCCSSMVHNQLQHALLQ